MVSSVIINQATINKYLRLIKRKRLKEWNSGIVYLIGRSTQLPIIWESGNEVKKESERSAYTRTLEKEAYLKNPCNGLSSDGDIEKIGTKTSRKIAPRNEVTFIFYETSDRFLATSLRLKVWRTFARLSGEDSGILFA